MMRGRPPTPNARLVRLRREIALPRAYNRGASSHFSRNFLRSVCATSQHRACPAASVVVAHPRGAWISRSLSSASANDARMKRL